ncbi:Uu.00g036960.m01.CDS01 [Anthostomella pinea]|uniref:Uu.00g036960.m01.CDS01 n=1 Tax=Anthostomella pinea TaxID=933095 RepID=A0AAI8V4L9_9PEZI|nr:Uu.00g036960.m01.CDS01 [Anthostomella pinea]
MPFPPPGQSRIRPSKALPSDPDEVYGMERLNSIPMGDALNQQEIRELFQGTVPFHVQRRLINSRSLRQALFGTAAEDDIRRAMVQSEVSMELRRQLENNFPFLKPAAPSAVGSPGHILRDPDLAVIHSPSPMANGIATATGTPTSNPIVSSAKQAIDQASSVEKAFTAKRTNRPERPLPAAAGANPQPSANWSPSIAFSVKKGAIKGSLTSPKPARIKVHYGWQFNDNGDGTLSAVGKKNGVSAKVISKKPLDPKEPPMLDPKMRLQDAKARGQSLLGTSEAGHASSIPKATPKSTPSTDTSLQGLDTRIQPTRTSQRMQATLNAPALGSPPPAAGDQGDQTKLWHYIHSRLNSTPRSRMPQNCWLPDLLRLPRLREVEYNPAAPYPYKENRPGDIAAMVIQVTGAEPPKACERCRTGKGIFKGCYVIHPNAPLTARQSPSLAGCANCTYKNVGRRCELKQWAYETYPELGIQPDRASTEIQTQPDRPSTQTPNQPDRPSTETQTEPDRPASQTPNQPDRPSTETQTEPDRPASQTQTQPGSHRLADKHPERRSERILLKDSAAAVSPAHASGRRMSATAGGVAFPPVSATAKTHQIHNHDLPEQRHAGYEESGSFSNVQGSAVNPTHLLQLETWEVAPGRIRNDGQFADNIAFSNSYLAQNLAVRISRDISFQVITVKPGTAYNFEAIADRLRLCSVASGKLKVKIGDQEFDMGPNGMFKVNTQTAAAATNMLYIDATVHVSIMPSHL